MPTPLPLRRLLSARVLCCAVEDARSLARETRERERERERTHTRGRETQTERRPAAAKGSTQGLSIAELEVEQEARVLLVKQTHIIMEVKGRVMTHRRRSHMA